jgi:hypothetical protein
MIAKIQIPKGWRKLRFHEKLKAGDAILYPNGRPFMWYKVPQSFAGTREATLVDFYIRRIKRKATK